MSEEQSQPASSEAGLRPDAGLEIVQGHEYLAENVAISGRHFIRCSFNFCNLIYSGGPVGLVECGGGNNRLVEVGPVREVLNGAAPQDVAEKMLRYWKDVRKGLNLEGSPESASDSQAAE
jgi:hypothetical protein